MIYKVSSVIKSFYKHIDKKVNFLVLISKIRICFRMLTLSSINLLALQAFIAFYNSSGMLRLELHTSSQGKLNFVWSREYKLKISGCATCRCGSEEKVWVVVLHWAVLMSRASARRRSQTPVQDKPGRPLGTQPLLRGGACAPLRGGHVVAKRAQAALQPPRPPPPPPANETGSQARGGFSVGTGVGVLEVCPRTSRDGSGSVGHDYSPGPRTWKSELGTPLGPYVWMRAGTRSGSSASIDTHTSLRLPGATTWISKLSSGYLSFRMTSNVFTYWCVLLNVIKCPPKMICKQGFEPRTRVIQFTTFWSLLKYANIANFKNLQTSRNINPPWSFIKQHMLLYEEVLVFFPTTIMQLWGRRLQSHSPEFVSPFPGARQGKPRLPVTPGLRSRVAALLSSNEPGWALRSFLPAWKAISVWVSGQDCLPLSLKRMFSEKIKDSSIIIFLNFLIQPKELGWQEPRISAPAWFVTCVLVCDCRPHRLCKLRHIMHAVYEFFRLGLNWAYFLDDFVCLAYFFGYSFLSLISFIVMSYFKWWEMIQVLSRKGDFKSCNFICHFLQIHIHFTIRNCKWK